MCLPTLCSAQKEAQPARSPSESERLRDGSRVCETNMPLTHREHTHPQLPASCSSYESTSCLWLLFCSFRKQNKTKKQQQLLWCHEAKYKYVIIPLACVQIWSYFHDWSDFGCVCVNITPTYVHTHVHTMRCVNIYYIYIMWLLTAVF